MFLHLTYYVLENGKQRKQTRYPSASSDELPTCPWRCYARANPDIRLRDIADLVMKKYKCKVIPNQCTNAKKYALTKYENTIGEHYAMLRSYGKAILDSNPGSTIKLGVTVNPDDKTYFDRFYVCFVGLADGWKAGCRKLIDIDGCFLKSPNQGEILTAIGRDGNNHIYLVAWAVENVENKDNWTWFLELLEQDLGSSRGNGLTLMSNQHKGLIEAVKDVMSNVEHRQCARVPESYVPAWFETDMYFVAYHNFVKAVSGMNFWPDQSISTRVTKVGSYASCSNCKKPGHNKASCKEPVVEQTPKPKGLPGRPRKKQSVGDVEDVNVVLKGPVRDEGVGGFRGGASGSRGRGCAGGSKRGASGSRGGASGSRGGASVFRGGVSVSKGGDGGSRRGASGSKRKPMSSDETKKDKIRRM
ncbi:multidrug resistance-associated protein 5 [Tanacetum coccineum]